MRQPEIAQLMGSHKRFFEGSEICGGLSRREQRKVFYAGISLKIDDIDKIIAKFEKKSSPDNIRTAEDAVYFLDILTEYVSKHAKGIMIKSRSMKTDIAIKHISNGLANLADGQTLFLYDLLFEQREEEDIEIMNKIIFAYELIKNIAQTASWEISVDHSIKWTKETFEKYFSCISILCIRMYEIYQSMLKTGKANCFEHLEEEILWVEEYLDLQYNAPAIPDNLIIAVPA